MRRVTRIQTSDGVMHLGVESARRHANKRYGAALSKLTHQLIRETDGMYGKLTEFIDARIADFAALHALKGDMNLTNPEPDEDD